MNFLSSTHHSFKLVPASCMSVLDKVQINLVGDIQILQSACRLVEFVMGLKKLRTLNITMAANFCGEDDRQVHMCKLQKHPTLKEIRLNSFRLAADVTLTESLCSFFAMQQLKVLHLIFQTQVGVSIPRFLATLLSCCLWFSRG